MEFFAFVPALFFGVAAAIQSPTNAALAKSCGSRQATLVSFTGGLIIISIIAFLFGSGDLTQALHLPFWQLIGGLYSALTIFGLTKSLPVLGAAFSTTILTLGEITMSMLIDAYGWLGLPQTPTNGWKIIGIATLTLGMLFVYLGKRDESISRRTDNARVLIFIALTFFLGFAAALQAPTNAVLSRSVGYLEASFVNFAFGWVAILAISLIMMKGKPNTLKGTKPWQFLGGAYGAAGVICTAVATSFLGAGLMVAIGTFAQLFTSIVIDIKGWFWCEKTPMSKWRAIGVATIALGIVFTALGKMI